jgi:FkbM family methyltransferase
VGFWSFLLSQWFKKVYAFEPSAEMRALFARNVTAPNVQVFPVALSDRNGRGSLRRPVAGNSGSTFVEMDVDGDVECRTLDSYQLSDVGFIKIDVEGAEYLVLSGARETIARSRPLIIAEQKQFGSRFGRSPEEVRGFLGELGYVLAQTVVKDEIFVPAEMLKRAS